MNNYFSNLLHFGKRLCALALGWSRLAILFITIVFLHSPCSFAEGTLVVDYVQDNSAFKIVKPTLTAEEKTWLHDHPVIRLGVDDSYAPYSYFDEQGHFQGMAADFVHILEQQLGVAIQPVKPMPWPALMKAAQQHRIDMITTLALLPERLQYFAFTDVYLKTPSVIMTRSNDYTLSKAADLKHRKVALVSGYSSSKQVLHDYPTIIPMFVNSPLQGLIAVSTGQADAYVGAIGVNINVASRNGIANLRVAAAFDIYSGQRFGIRKDWALLAAIIDKALAAIPENEKDRIHQHWVPQPIPEKNSSPLLSKFEKQWIAENTHLRYGLYVNDEPHEFVDSKGNVAGLIPAYLALLRLKSGLSIEVIEYDSSEKLKADFNAGKLEFIHAKLGAINGIDVTSTVSIPFHRSTLAVFALRDEKFIGGESDLDGKSIAVSPVGLHAAFFRKHTEEKPHVFDNSLLALDSVVKGKYDVAILEVSAANYLIRKYQLNKVQMEYILPAEETNLRFEIRTGLSVLIDIVNKTLASFNQDEVTTIRRNNLNVDNARNIDPETIRKWALWIFIIVLTIVLLQFYYGNQKLKVEIQRRRFADESAKSSEQRFSLTFEQAAVGIALVSPEGAWLRVNNFLCNMLGYVEEELIKKTFQDITCAEDLAADLQQLKRLLDGELNTYKVEKRYIRKDGKLVWGGLTVALVRNQAGEPDYLISVIEDMTKRKGDEARIEYLAFRDILTGLPNRELFADRMLLAMAEAQRMEKKLALMFLDLDHFKEVNDTLGHAVGDKLLIQVTERLKGCLRAVDTLGRQGGDEFLLIITNIAFDELSQAVSAAADKIFEHLKPVFQIDGHEIAVTASIGIGIYPDDGTDFNTLLRKADTAMYSAKTAGRNAYYFFTEQMNKDAVEHEQLRSGLRHALEHNEFHLQYQPQVDCLGKYISGVEALLRWTHPVLGPVSPARFIPVAEACGLIIPIGAWVLEEACRQAVAWHAAGCKDLLMAVNLSAVQFKHGDLINTVLNALQHSGLKPQFLELELTESILIHDANAVLNVVSQLKEHGIRLSLDDFGTGYSSLTYLKRFPIDKLKIDQSFVQDMINNSDDEAIVKTIISLAKNLRMSTIVEGIETLEQLEILRRLGCDEYQGYYFARPMRAEDFVIFYEEHFAQKK
ncbi:MAG: EAL domain-containing protein [Gallionellaceae bacterium]